VDEPVEDEVLARFQEALVEALAVETTPDGVQRRLAQDARAAPFAAYVAGFDERCVEVTAALMRRWAARAVSR
jgi:hypothetical protein